MSQKKIKPKDKRKYELEINNKLLRDRLSELYVLCSWLLQQFIYCKDDNACYNVKYIEVKQKDIQSFIDSNQAMIVERLDDGSVKLRIGYLDESTDDAATSTK